MPIKNLLNLTGDRLYTLPLVVLYLTDGCNSRCAMCDIWQKPRRNMAMALVDDLAAAFHDIGVKWVLLSGGEAMQHPEWPQIAATFKQAGARVMLLTNGLLVRKQAQAVIDHIDELIVSLDGGTAATYEAIRGVDAFDLVLDGIRQVRQAGLPVTTRTTVQKANFRELGPIIDAALSVDVTQISFLAVDISNPFAFGERSGVAMQGDSLPVLPVSPMALSSAEVSELAAIIDALATRYAPEFTAGRIAESPAKLRRILVDYFAMMAGVGQMEAPRCNAPHFSTVIEVDGTLRPCYFLPAYGQVQAGDSLGQAVNVPAAQALRQAYRTGQRPECAACVCPLYKGPRQLATFA